MLDSIFATKLDMTQAWSKQGKRLAVTRCRVGDNLIVDQKAENIFEVGYGKKKLKNMSKPLRSKLQKSGFLMGVTKLEGIQQTQSAEARDDNADKIKIGDVVKVGQILEVGDIVSVQGSTKGRGFAGVMKRHGFHGGSRTHGQSDRERAPGSIGAGTDPGRVWPGLKMAGHYGCETKTVRGLVVIHIDPNTSEVWLNGPVPGYFSATIKITKTGQKKTIELDNAASGIAIEKSAPEPTQEAVDSDKVESQEEEAKS